VKPEGSTAVLTAMTDPASAIKVPEAIRSDESNGNQNDLAPATDFPETTRSDESNADQNDKADRPVKYRQYLIDRTNGNSKLGQSKPPCCACFVPKPVVWFADYIEQNRVFETLGKFGLFDASNLQARRICIGLGLVGNILCLGLSIYVCFAVSTEFDIIRKTAFTNGLVSYSIGDIATRQTLRAGMRAIAIEASISQHSLNPEVIAEVVEFDEFCNRTRPIMNPADCGNCYAASGSMIATLFVSLIMCIPSITTSVLRLYPHYDCNCQKVFGSFAAIISVGFAIYTFVIYQFRCFRSFGFGTICIHEDGEIIDAPNGSCPPDFVTVQRLFWAGPGWISLSVASGLKILDMLFNFAIPTPTICRDPEEQREYELLVKGEDKNENGEETKLEETSA
jgi:hypothetical protein